MPFEKEKIYSHYLPIAGNISAMIFSVNIMNQPLFKRTLSPYDMGLSNALWLNAHIGVGLYVYTRPHLTAKSEKEKVVYSVFSSVLFNFGTVLLLATAKKLLPEHETTATLFGLATTGALFYIGKSYLNCIDEN